MRMRSASLHLVAVYAWSGSAGIHARPRLVAPLEVDVFYIKGVDVTGEVAVGVK
jgi:hypothetical protein